MGWVISATAEISPLPKLVSAAETAADGKANMLKEVLFAHPSRTFGIPENAPESPCNHPNVKTTK